MIKNKPVLPLLIYDADCTVCRLWVDYWKSLTGDRVKFTPFQNVAGEFPEIPLEHYKNFVHFITPEGEFFKGAEAVFRVLSYCKGKGWLLWMYAKIPGFSSISELNYRLFATHRSFLYRVTLLFWGKDLGPERFIISRWVFLRLLGIIYFIAFLSFWLQLDGLIGSNGISPADIYLGSLDINYGWKAYFKIPTLAWINNGDFFLGLIPFAGMLLSGLLIAGILSVPVLVALWFLYLSIVSIGQAFMSFQWDALLLEAGFLAFFLAPPGFIQKLNRESSPSTIIIWLYRFLLFRLMFSSGIGKFVSGDPTWRDFTALNYHYYTQPLPTPIAWYVHQLPEWFHKISVGTVLFIEIVIPFFVFAPRRLRHIAGITIMLLQVLIMFTGNYAYFNLLTIALIVLLFDDAFFQSLLLKKLKIINFQKKAIAESNLRRSIKEIVLVALAAFVILLGTIQLVRVFTGYRNLPSFVQNVMRWVSPYRIVNNYGLFTGMTTSRPEIIIEGSNDGQNWLEYGFKYKPVELNKYLPWVAPHQPRLDWQMWFAALGSYQTSPWFPNLMYRILEGSPDVLELLDHDPFPDGPPKYLRAMVYEYKFSGLNTKRATGNLWERELKGLYLPVLTIPPN